VSASDPGTLAFYQEQAVSYLEARPHVPDAHLTAFLDRLKPSARILELGCGGGHDAAFMVSRGFDVDATDGAVAMAEQAGALLGRAVRVMRFDELDARSRYDAVVANASLLHVPIAGLPDCLARIWRALKPGGQHFATFKTGAERGADIHGRYYNQPELAELERLYHQSGGWDELQIERFMGTGYFSAPSEWLLCTARRAN
jgi:cyclopropane fatty-acyl-phospholipid synthase-like methyltransferase